MSPLLIISPHLDDAVLSCGARIYDTVQSGRKVVVATCFTDGGPSMETLYIQRRADDELAVRSLGAERVLLGFCDAPFRNSRYHNFSTILFHHDLPDDERPLVSEISEAVQSLAEEYGSSEIIFPLGIGGHIDHHLVWESSKFFGDGKFSVSYYEDLPYALVPGWSEVRRSEIGFGCGPVVCVPLETLPYPFVKNYMGSEDDLRASIMKYEAGFERCYERNEKNFIRNLYTSAALSMKCEAIGAYSTEWPVLFGEDRMDIRRYVAGLAETCVEIYWTLNKTS